METLKEAWYCVACKTGAEEATSQQLTRTVGIDVFLPTMRMRGGGNVTIRSVALFPGYLFVRASLLSSLSGIRYTVGVRDIVRFGDRIPLVPDEVIEDLRRLVHQDFPNARSKIAEGMVAEIEEGPFQGFVGTVMRVTSAKDRVHLLIDLLGRALLLETEIRAARFLYEVAENDPVGRR